MPNTVAEVEAMTWEEMKFVFALTHAQAIRGIAEHGADAVRAEVDRWEPEARATVARALAKAV
jgi:hypothetical protein